jgi:hypothetical protein
VDAGVGTFLLNHRRRHLGLALGSEILEVLLLGVTRRREHGTGLEPQELGPRRSDPPWCRTEPALAKHRGDGGVRNLDPELQELSFDP